MPTKLSQLMSRMDALYEYDREPVAQDQLKTGWQFASIFAGEHVAGTEFVIGAFFVLHGVTATDLIIGLAVGNLLAVLSWTLICAPVAVQSRLTLYWYLRRIAGPGLTSIYNVANAILYCVLAGAMIAVSATAIGLPLGIRTPSLTDVYPTSAGWVALTFLIGTAFVTLAILGFEKLSKFARVCAPWILVIFVVGAVAVLPRLGVHTNLDNFWDVAVSRIWNGVTSPGQDKFSVWHIVFFAWFCNLAMHVALSDMALLRYARHWLYGLYSALGMYPGHMLAWLCSGIMVAAVGRQMDPGMMAAAAAGVVGPVAVVLAGWTTANPTLYRAGLALQCVTPGWPRWKVTLIAGFITTVLSCFPVIFMRLLDYVAIYGLVLMPMGAVVIAEHWIFPALGIPQYRTERLGRAFNWRAGITWVATLAGCSLMPMHLFFRWLPGYFLALALYVVLSLPSRNAVRAYAGG